MLLLSRERLGDFIAGVLGLIVIDQSVETVILLSRRLSTRNADPWNVLFLVN